MEKFTSDIKEVFFSRKKSKNWKKIESEDLIKGLNWYYVF